jgi:hypothetical protein
VIELGQLYSGARSAAFDTDYGRMSPDGGVELTGV